MLLGDAHRAEGAEALVVRFGNSEADAVDEVGDFRALRFEAPRLAEVMLDEREHC